MKTKQDREPMAISDLGVWLGCLSCRKVGRGRVLGFCPIPGLAWGGSGRKAMKK